ncbi:uncharacterized protein LOC21384093, partial [Morus notabilis]
MAMAHCHQSPTFSLFPNPNYAHNKKFSSFSVRCSSNSPPNAEDNSPRKKKRLSQQSLWEAKDSEGRDYLYRLGKEADNMNIAVGARSGVIDDLFAGNFLGRDSDIVFDYRQKVTRSFEYLQGDYYIAPLFMHPVPIVERSQTFLGYLQELQGVMCLLLGLDLTKGGNILGK